MKIFGGNIKRNADRNAMKSGDSLKNAGAGRLPENGETVEFTFTGENIKFAVTAKSIAVDWGDGTEEELSNLDSTEVRHTYAGAGEHTVRIQAENLSLFNCIRQRLTALDVSNCTALTGLKCLENQLSALDVSSNTALKMLRCEYNQLSELNVNGCTALTVLSCVGNQLIALDVSKNTALIMLICGKNQLSADALNRIFTDLPDEYGGISIGDNPGTDTCKRSIAKKKKWEFY
jgi:Leucine-rich repeat (LRR) protein